MNIDYPINGTDLNISIQGKVFGSLDDYEAGLEKVIARIGNTEVFRYDGECESGLLKYSELSEEIMNISTTILVEEQFHLND